MHDGDAEDREITCKVILIGESGVGKSSLLLRFTDDAWNSRPVSTIGQDYKTRTIKDLSARVEVWDTAGQERFRTITSSFFRNAQGALLVFDLADRKSFDRLKNWISELERFAPPGIQRAVVGNKSDLNLRPVGADVVKEFCSKHKLPYQEVSAKTGEGVDTAFESLARRIVKDGNTSEGRRNRRAFGLDRRRRPSAASSDIEAGCCC